MLNILIYKIDLHIHIHIHVLPELFSMIKRRVIAHSLPTHALSWAQGLHRRRIITESHSLGEPVIIDDLHLFRCRYVVMNLYVLTTEYHIGFLSFAEKVSLASLTFPPHESFSDSICTRWPWVRRAREPRFGSLAGLVRNPSIS